MKTKYYPWFIVLGVTTALGLGSEVSNHSIQSSGLSNLVIIIIAVSFLGYGFKLKGLAKKGIKDTKDIKKTTQEKEVNMIKFRELSKPLKVAVIISYILGTLYTSLIILIVVGYS